MLMIFWCILRCHTQYKQDFPLACEKQHNREFRSGTNAGKSSALVKYRELFEKSLVRPVALVGIVEQASGCNSVRIELPRDSSLSRQ